MHRIVVASLCLISLGCGAKEQSGDLVWAINMGGPAYYGVDGTTYDAETSIRGGTVGAMETVKGSQDATLYETYREGDMAIAHPIASGSYDITFHFAEPEDIGPGDRVFDVYAEGKRVIDDLDVVMFRDGKTESALTVTVPGVQVTEGELHIKFDASAGEPLLSAVAVRAKQRPPPDRELAWSDEFDYDGRPDPELWYIEDWPPRVANSEDQAYTTRPRNVRVADGVLIIEAHKEDYDGAEYTSARIRSVGEGDIDYGRVEVRARLPGGVGTWAAIWMLPRDPYFYATNCGPGDDIHGTADCNAWPNSGEIDIMEYVGYQENHIHGTVHNEAHYFIKWNQHKGRILIDGVEDEFHVYALEWSPERIDIFVDDSRYFTYVNEQLGWQAWPYDKPFYLILNLAIGGDWGRAGGPIDDSVLPQRMLVDWVRVYRMHD